MHYCIVRVGNIYLIMILQGRGKGGNIPKKAMNEEELDAELNEYMKKSAN